MLNIIWVSLLQQYSIFQKYNKIIPRKQPRMNNPQSQAQSQQSLRKLNQSRTQQITSPQVSSICTPNSTISITPTLIPPTVQQIKKNTIFANYYMDEIKKIYRRGQFCNATVDVLYGLFTKTNLYYLIELYDKLCAQDYRILLSNLQLVERQQQYNIIEKGRKSSVQYILLQGQVSYNIKAQGQSQQLIQVGTGYTGYTVYPQIFMSPRYVNFIVKCQTQCTFLTLTEQLYNRILKKLVIKEIDWLAGVLSQMGIFVGMGVINMRKYLPYFIYRNYKYNQVIYSQGSENYTKQSQQMYIILRGQVQIYTKLKQSNINIVNLGYQQCFGLSYYLQQIYYKNNNNISNIAKFNAKSIQSDLKVLVLSKNAFEIIRSQNPCVVQNCTNYFNKIYKFHSLLANKNMKIMNNKQQIRIKVSKRKKKKGKKNNNSLTWWGLAQNVKIQHKYRIDRAPQGCLTNKQQKQDNKSQKNLLLSHKINQLKKRILDTDQNQNQINNYKTQQNQQRSPYKSNNNYIPRIKTRIKMLEVKPKAIDMTEIVKKKLITYAKNMGSFCDRLNLE